MSDSEQLIPMALSTGTSSSPLTVPLAIPMPPSDTGAAEPGLLTGPSSSKGASLISVELMFDNSVTPAFKNAHLETNVSCWGILELWEKK